jgi:hypothetical protein
MQKVELKKYPFVLIMGNDVYTLDEIVMGVANLHKLTALIVELVEDGVRDIDTIVNIIGRKIL